MGRDARVGVGAQGVEGAPRTQDLGVDLDGVDALHATGQGEGDVRAAAGADHEHRPVGAPAVQPVPLDVREVGIGSLASRGAIVWWPMPLAVSE